MLTIVSHQGNADQKHHEIMRYHFLPVRMTMIQKKKKKKPGKITSEDLEKLEPLYIAGGNVRWCSCCRKQPGSSSKSETESPQELATLLLGKYPKELKTSTQMNRCSHTFTAVLFTALKERKPA